MDTSDDASEAVAVSPAEQLLTMLRARHAERTKLEQERLRRELEPKFAAPPTSAAARESLVPRGQQLDEAPLGLSSLGRSALNMWGSALSWSVGKGLDALGLTLQQEEQQGVSLASSDAAEETVEQREARHKREDADLARMLASLRQAMTSDKLYPAGDVYHLAPCRDASPAAAAAQS